MPSLRPSRGAILAGDFLIVCGGVGLVLGIVPFAVSLLRLAGVTFGLGPHDWAAHGVGAMGLDVPWAALSSACGAFLGGLLVAAGLGWRRARPWAPLVTLIYALLGILVTGTDLAIFALAARPGAMRTSMLIADGLACALAAGTLLALILWRRRLAADGSAQELAMRERKGGTPRSAKMPGPAPHRMPRPFHRPRNTRPRGAGRREGASGRGAMDGWFFRLGLAVERTHEAGWGRRP